MRFFFGLVMLAAAGQMIGCEVDSFFDPSKTGRFEFTPTTVPILERIDVVEQPDPWYARASQVTPEDLLPSDLSYRLAPNDVIRVEVYELFTTQEWFVSVRRIDASGNFRLPEIGDVRAAGLTAQQFEEELSRRLEAVINNPQVTVVVEEGGGFQYTIYGLIEYPGVYSLRRPDFRLREAIAQAGYVPNAFVDKVYVIRSATIEEGMDPFTDQPEQVEPRPDVQPTPPDIDELIEQLGQDRPQSSSEPKPGAVGARSARGIEMEELNVAGQDQEPPPVDIEDVNTARPQDTETQPPKPRQITPDEPSQADTFIFIPERGEWVRVKAGDAPQPPMPQLPDDERRRMVVDRIIEIPYESLRRGDSSYNLVIRPGDAIYVQEPEVGVVYIDGEVIRPGVFNLPISGRLTLSRLFSAAGGGTAIAIPSRVDLIRRVGENREAKLRVNLAAIRQGNEPDIFLKPDDHIIVGTNWFATPLAVIRNGFRATYGFGFLLDRNFGLDVFPPDDTLRGFSN
jgi:polysaccharide export outer membrane protein